MAKSNKATVLRRVNEVTRLILAGAEYPEIKQYGADQGWKLSERQIRRYMERCYKRLAQSTQRNRKELLGRHLMQRRAIYARCLKNNDLRTAVLVLKDEAELEGLYPAAKAGGSLSLNNHDGAGNYISPLPKIDLIRRSIAAELADDPNEQALLEAVTPVNVYRHSATLMPIAALHTATLIYVNEQLEQAATFLHAVWRLNGDAEDDCWTDMALIAAYRFKVGKEGWELFMAGLDLDRAYFESGNYQGAMLELCSGNFCAIAVTHDEVREAIERLNGIAPDEVVTATDLAESWRAMFRHFRIC